MVEWYKGQGWIRDNEDAEAVMRKNPICKGCWNEVDDYFVFCSEKRSMRCTKNAVLVSQPNRMAKWLFERRLSSIQEYYYPKY